MPTQVYLFTIGINTYTLYIGLGALIGMAYALWQGRGSSESLSHRLTGVLIIAVLAVAVGRAGYVLLHADYFSEHMTEIVSALSPGLWEQAVIVGGVLGWRIANRLHRLLTPMALVIVASLAGIGASLGCIGNGCAYGREVFWTDGWIWALRVDWPDAYILNNPRLPTQVFMIAWLMLCLLLIIVPQWIAVLRNRSQKNHAVARSMESESVAHRSSEQNIVPVWILLFAIGDFLVQFIRADTQQTIAGLRWSQCADAVLFAASILYLIVIKIRLPTNRD